MDREAIADAVERIVRDLSDRKGLKSEWHMIDEGVQDEIKATWADAILQAIAPAPVWRDMDSAPKDGAVIDLWDEQGFRKPDCQWDEKLKGWKQPYARSTMGAAGTVFYVGNPIYWMPAPHPEGDAALDEMLEFTKEFERPAPDEEQQMQMAIEQDRAPDEGDAVKEAAREILDQVFSTYKARNGREVGIEDCNGEKVWLLPDDAYHALRALSEEQPEQVECRDCKLMDYPCPKHHPATRREGD